MAKLFSSTSKFIVDKSLQLHGGYGYCKEYPVERHYRDQRITDNTKEQVKCKGL